VLVKRRLDGWSSPSRAETTRRSAPPRRRAAPRRGGTSAPDLPSSSTVHAPHTPCSQPRCVPVSSRSWRRKSARVCEAHEPLRGLAVDREPHHAPLRSWVNLLRHAFRAISPLASLSRLRWATATFSVAATLNVHPRTPRVAGSLGPRLARNVPSTPQTDRLPPQASLAASQARLRARRAGRRPPPGGSRPTRGDRSGPRGLAHQFLDRLEEARRPDAAPRSASAEFPHRRHPGFSVTPASSPTG